MKINDKILKKWYNYEPQIINEKIVQRYNSDIIKNLNNDNHNVDIVIIYSGRDRGKSFDISSKAILKAIESNGQYQFAYVRRLQTEIDKNSVENYFADKTRFLCDISDGEYTSFLYKSGWVYVVRYNDEGKIEKELKICKVFSLSTVNKYKSQQFPNIKEIIFEEVFTDTRYLIEEPNKVLNLLSTVAREGRHVTLWLISNLVSRVNPYINDWTLSHMYTQKQGTIDTYKLKLNEFDAEGKERYLLIACEYLADSLSEIGVNDNRKSRKLRLKNEVTISTLNNKWEEKNTFPIISNKFITQFECLYICVFENRGFRYLFRVYNVPNNIQNVYMNYLDDTPIDFSEEFMLVGFVERKTTNVLEKTRLFTDRSIINQNTTRGIYILNEEEKEIFTLISIGRVFFANNLIGNEFFQNYNELKNI